jgi:hypothetical protein
LQFKHLRRDVGGSVGSTIKRNQYPKTASADERKSSRKKIQKDEEGRRLFSESFEENPGEEDPGLDRQFPCRSISTVARIVRLSVIGVAVPMAGR